MANENFQVNGPAIICLALNQTSGLKRLGVSVDGVNVRIQRITEEVQTDVSGPGPADKQLFGLQATITAVLRSYNEDVFEEWQRIVVANAIYENGTSPPSGIMLGGTGNLKPLAIASPYGLKPYTFPWCEATIQEVKLGTKSKGYALTVEAIDYVGPGMSKAGAVLFHRRPFAVPE